MDTLCQSRGIRQTLSSWPLQVLVHALMEEVEGEQKRLNQFNRLADSHSTAMQDGEDLQALLHVHSMGSSITCLCRSTHISRTNTSLHFVGRGRCASLPLGMRCMSGTSLIDMRDTLGLKGVCRAVHSATTRMPSSSSGEIRATAKSKRGHLYLCKLLKEAAPLQLCRLRGGNGIVEDAA